VSKSLQIKLPVVTQNDIVKYVSELHY